MIMSYPYFSTEKKYHIDTITSIPSNYSMSFCSVMTNGWSPPNNTHNHMNVTTTRCSGPAVT